MWSEASFFSLPTALQPTQLEMHGNRRQRRSAVVPPRPLQAVTSGSTAPAYLLSTPLFLPVRVPHSHTSQVYSLLFFHGTKTSLHQKTKTGKMQLPEKHLRRLEIKPESPAKSSVREKQPLGLATGEQDSLSTRSLFYVTYLHYCAEIVNTAYYIWSEKPRSFSVCQGSHSYFRTKGQLYLC